MECTQTRYSLNWRLCNSHTPNAISHRKANLQQYSFEAADALLCYKSAACQVSRSSLGLHTTVLRVAYWSRNLISPKLIFRRDLRNRCNVPMHAFHVKAQNSPHAKSYRHGCSVMFNHSWTLNISKHTCRVLLRQHCLVSVVDMSSCLQPRPYISTKSALKTPPSMRIRNKARLVPEQCKWQKCGSLYVLSALDTPMKKYA